MASSEKLYTRSQVAEAYRLAVATGFAPQLTVMTAFMRGSDEVPETVLRFLELEPVGKKFRRCAGASVDTAGAAGVSGGFGSENHG